MSMSITLSFIKQERGKGGERMGKKVKIKILVEDDLLCGPNYARVIAEDDTIKVVDELWKLFTSSSNFSHFPLDLLLIIRTYLPPIKPCGTELFILPEQSSSISRAKPTLPEQNFSISRAELELPVRTFWVDENTCLLNLVERMEHIVPLLRQQWWQIQQRINGTFRPQEWVKYPDRSFRKIPERERFYFLRTITEHRPLPPLDYEDEKNTDNITGDRSLLLIKYFDTEKNALSYVGSVVVPRQLTVQQVFDVAILPLLKQYGFAESDDKTFSLLEEVKADRSKFVDICPTETVDSQGLRHGDILIVINI